jgi:hypothetical protein
MYESPGDLNDVGLCDAYVLVLHVLPSRSLEGCEGGRDNVRAHLSIKKPLRSQGAARRGCGCTGEDVRQVSTSWRTAVKERSLLCVGKYSLVHLSMRSLPPAASRASGTRLRTGKPHWMATPSGLGKSDSTQTWSAELLTLLMAERADHFDLPFGKTWSV